MKNMTAKMWVVPVVPGDVLCRLMAVWWQADCSVRMSVSRYHGVIRVMAGSLLSSFQLEQKRKLAFDFFFNHKKQNKYQADAQGGGCTFGRHRKLIYIAEQTLIPRRDWEQWTQWERKKESSWSWVRKEQRAEMVKGKTWGECEVHCMKFSKN